MSEWEPATEAEAAMREALLGGDQEEYFAILAQLDLLLPVAAGALGGPADIGWGTWTTDGRTHVLAFTSPRSLRECLAEHAGPYRRLSFDQLAATWPNIEWWLAVNPGLPVEAYLPAWFVNQINRGDIRLPGRTLGARARMEHARRLRGRPIPPRPGPAPAARDRLRTSPLLGRSADEPAASDHRVIQGTVSAGPVLVPPPDADPMGYPDVSASPSTGSGAPVTRAARELTAGPIAATPMPAPSVPAGSVPAAPLPAAPPAAGPRPADVRTDEFATVPGIRLGVPPSAPFGGPEGAGRPEAGRSEAGRPEAGRSEAGRSEAGRSEAGRSEAGRPEERRVGLGQLLAESLALTEDPAQPTAASLDPDPTVRVALPEPAQVRPADEHPAPALATPDHPAADFPAPEAFGASRWPDDEETVPVREADLAQLRAGVPPAGWVGGPPLDEDITRPIVTRADGGAGSGGGDERPAPAAEPVVKSEPADERGGSMKRPPSGEAAAVSVGGAPDAAAPDAGTPDAGTPDAGTPDAGTPDAGTPDAAAADAGTPDGAVSDRPEPDRSGSDGPALHDLAPDLSAEHADPGRPTPPEPTTATEAAPALPEATINTTAFEPANPVEEDLLQAARSGQSDRVLSTLLLAKVLLPDWSGDDRTFDPADVRKVTIDNALHVLAFTSAARLRERLGEEAAASWIKFTSLIAAWPGSAVSFAVNPGTPVGATIPGEEILALANWAAELGLGREPDPEPEPVKRSSPAPRPAPSSQSAAGPLLMQKPISPEQLSFYLDRGYDRVSGFVYRAGEVAHLRTPDDFYRALGLHYSGSAFKPDAAEIYLLRWVAARVNLYRIPYGGQHEAAMRAMEGWVIERPPFRGNGFAPSDTGDVIAEFKVDSVRLPHGAQLWRADRDGNEHLVAVLDADGPRWQPVAAP